MFQQWDGDNDGELTLKELAPLEGDSNEKCLRAYIDRCGTILYQHCGRCKMMK